MAETRGQSPEQIALQRLLSADADAQACLHDAQAQTTRTLAEGKEAALRRIEQARTAAEAEAEAARQAANVQLLAEVDQLQQQAHRDAVVMRLRTQEQIAAAVELVLNWVKGEA